MKYVDWDILSLLSKLIHLPFFIFQPLGKMEEWLVELDLWTGLPETNLAFCLCVKGTVGWFWRYGGPLRGWWKTWKPCEESISECSVGGSPLIWWYQCLGAGSVNRTNAIRQQQGPEKKQDRYLCPWNSRVAQSTDTHIMTRTHPHIQVYKVADGIAVHLKVNH